MEKIQLSFKNDINTPNDSDTPNGDISINNDAIEKFLKIQLINILKMKHINY